MTNHLTAPRALPTSSTARPSTFGPGGLTVGDAERIAARRRGVSALPAVPEALAAYLALAGGGSEAVGHATVGARPPWVSNAFSQGDDLEGRLGLVARRGGGGLSRAVLSLLRRNFALPV